MYATTEEENERPKRIVAKQALALEVKSELLKKRLSISRKGRAYNWLSVSYEIGFCLPKCLLLSIQNWQARRTNQPDHLNLDGYYESTSQVIARI